MAKSETIIFSIREHSSVVLLVLSPSPGSPSKSLYLSLRFKL